jgi:hypothetical protein
MLYLNSYNFMKKEDITLIIIFSLASVVTMFFGFDKIMIDKDFLVYMHAPCRIESGNSCFQTESELYHKVYRKAYYVDFCHKTDLCDVFSCKEDEQGCEEIFCSEDLLEEGERCVQI